MVNWKSSFESDQKFSVDAYYNLGVIYEQGLSVPKDIKTTIRYYKKAAEKVRSQIFNLDQSLSTV